MEQISSQRLLRRKFPQIWQNFHFDLMCKLNFNFKFFVQSDLWALLWNLQNLFSVTDANLQNKPYPCNVKEYDMILTLIGALVCIMVVVDMMVVVGMMVVVIFI